MYTSALQNIPCGAAERMPLLLRQSADLRELLPLSQFCDCEMHYTALYFPVSRLVRLQEG